MKKFLYTSLVALAGFFAVSCQQEHIEVVYDPAAVTVQTLGEFADVVLDKDGEKIVTTFAPADFKLAVATAYQLNASASSDMANKVKVSASIDIDEKGLGTISIKQTDLNALVYALGGVADEPMTLYFQLSASVATDKKAAIGATTKESNIVSAVFTPYPTVVKDVTLYDHVWVIGSSASVGSWSFEKVYQYLYDYEKKGETFTGLIDLPAASSSPVPATGMMQPSTGGPKPRPKRRRPRPSPCWLTAAPRISSATATVTISSPWTVLPWFSPRSTASTTWVSWVPSMDGLPMTPT